MPCLRNFARSLWKWSDTKERDLFSLPFRMSGMNVPNLTLMTDDICSTSRRSTDVLVWVIKGDRVYEIEANAMWNQSRGIVEEEKAACWEI